jgi:hypothetical protein
MRNFKGRPRLLRNCVLVDLADLHNHDKVFAGIFEQLDVGNRITVNQQQVGQCAFLDHAKLKRNTDSVGQT